MEAGLRYISLAVAVVLTAGVSAQDRREKKPGPKHFDKKEFSEKRNAYLTEQMGLTSEEASVFLPLENELIQKRFEAGRECHHLERELRHKENKTEEEYKQLLECQESVKAERDRLDKEYMEKFKAVLTSEKLYKYQEADRVFFSDLMKDKKRK